MVAPGRVKRSYALAGAGIRWGIPLPVWRRAVGGGSAGRGLAHGVQQFDQAVVDQLVQVVVVLASRGLVVADHQLVGLGHGLAQLVNEFQRRPLVIVIGGLADRRQHGPRRQDVAIAQVHHGRFTTAEGFDGVVADGEPGQFVGAGALDVVVDDRDVGQSELSGPVLDDEGLDQAPFEDDRNGGNSGHVSLLKKKARDKGPKERLALLGGEGKDGDRDWFMRNLRMRWVRGWSRCCQCPVERARSAAWYERKYWVDSRDTGPSRSAVPMSWPAALCSTAR